MEIYNKISTELYNDNTELHTYQLHRERGYRIVIRHLHSTTERQWIHDQLTAQGYTPRFIRVMQHRYKGRPMKLFEVELQPTMDGKNQSILKLERLGNQNVSVEKQRPKMDPVQCHSRHLSAFQAKLRAEQEQKEKNMQPAQESNGQHLQPDDCLSLAIKQNTHTIALMGQKMDMLSRLLHTTPQQTPQQRPIHIEPIVRIASPNPNDMSVGTIESNSQNKYANENRNE
ncbi:hypothetical protein ACLKA7_007749 [Drosophila subpalustris]